MDFTQEQILELKSKDIVAFMEASGYAHKHSSGKWTFFSSPFRQEGNPSFGVNTLLNTWSDFGGEDGGDLIALVMKLENMNFGQACEHIHFEKTIKFVEFERKDLENDKSIVVTEANVFNPILDHYMTQVRKIDKDVLYKYCKVVRFNFPASEYNVPCFAIGFKNDKGGWEVRNEHYKVASTPKWYTTIGEESECVNLFEGFINFLSMLTYFGIKGFKNRTYILNGTGQIGNLMPSLRGKRVNYFGDNDTAGNKVLVKLKKDCIVTDCRDTYEWFSDINEWLVNI